MLELLSNTTTMNTKTLLLILDGWGIGQNEDHNAIFNAKPAYWSGLLEKFPHTSLMAKEEYVGLPEGCLSGSEVGHTTIGAGRIVWQNAARIDFDINNGDFYKNSALGKIKKHLANFGGKLHFVGLLSDGGIHSHINHLLALIDWAKINKLPVCMHLFLDGRDMGPESGAELFAKKIQPILDDNIRVVTLCGRAIAMDRNENWERTGQIFNLLTSCGDIEKEDHVAWLQRQYNDKITDEFVLPVRFHNDVIGDDDAIMFFNFRADRMRQLCQMFLKTAPHVVLQKNSLPNNNLLVSMTRYGSEFSRITEMFSPQPLNNLLGEWLSAQNINQFRIAETEKYAHITYFFNGGREEPFKNEERLVIPSLGLTNYASAPEMSLPEVTNSLLRVLLNKKHEFIVCNIANGDMVGHSGDLEAGKMAVKAVDFALSKIVPVAQQSGYTVLITADHGNIEHMLEKNEPHTAHTFNNVPLIVTNNNFVLPRSGFLHQISPTILKIMNIPIPSEMDSASLL